MCGVAGLISNKGRTKLFYQQVVNDMSNSMLHRGPDAGGCWVDASSGVALGHRRLAVVELSKNGAQPMSSRSGRYVISYNGELYNHLEIRQLLQKQSRVEFRGGSDTETLLSAVEAWGLEKTLKALNGMFAFALWDKKNKRLSLARDRMGIKPLFYGLVDGDLVFSSELRAFDHCPGFKAEINRNALNELLHYSAVGAPRTIYQNIHKLEAGAFIDVCPDELQDDSKLLPKFYWKLEEVASRGISQPFKGDERDLIDELETLLRSSIRGQMISDVPMGGFLSGGIDSSTVISLMQAESVRPIKTFTIGFAEKDYDESGYARSVAKHLGTDHRELCFTLKDALNMLPSIATMCDEPFGDSSILPTYLVSRLARENITVALSGDGADELFGGYNRYVFGERIWCKSVKLPNFFANALRGAIHGLPPSILNSLAANTLKLLPGARLPRAFADKLYKIGDVLGAKNLDDFYDLILTRWPHSTPLVEGLENATSRQKLAHAGMDLPDAMMLWDQSGYLPDDILVKLDRASMAVSLEARVPLLDHRLVEFAWRVPLSAKIGNGLGKLPLRQVLYRHVPQELVNRPKVGFGLPIHDWLRGGLRDWAEALLDESRIRDQGYLNVDQVRRIWQEHISGRYNHQHLIWNILSFQAWYETRVR